MTKLHYPHLYEDWIREETERRSNKPYSKPFVGDRSYRHFDGRISLRDFQTGEAKIIESLKNPNKVEKHSFYPFIRNDKKQRRITKVINPETNEKERRIGQKNRPIMYASHTDACIYGFYAYILKQKHNRVLEQKGLSNNVIAYRKVPREDKPERNKSNIDFAKDIFNIVESSQDAAILCLDIKSFFDKMNHQLIQHKWAELLGSQYLPEGHRAIFKSITSYRYIFLNDAMKGMGLGSIIRGKFIYNKNAKRDGMIGNPKLYNKKLNNHHYIHKNHKKFGIPQGSPISDVIANLYLLEFDILLHEFLSKLQGAAYKRYSDDILVVCPKDSVIDVYNFIQNSLASEGLTLSEKKSELFFLNRAQREFKDQTSMIVPGYMMNKSTAQYLGFEFDLDGIHLRSGTVANHYRRLKRKLKRKKQEAEISAKKSFRRKSPRDRYGYIKLSSERMNSPRLDRQHTSIRKRTSKLRRNLQD